ncbi:hypothetical protein EOD39_16482 [Acipenser ruthenus]|uniref:Uncharacterized protein n=1 Tax=Acipenser ruthenus TaxID=7906 RepID=A0A444U9N5_ACIRT|nr:hypothetical protein EOD39_16482 [Acipenser ruthenus]
MDCTTIKQENLESECVDFHKGEVCRDFDEPIEKRIKEEQQEEGSDPGDVYEDDVTAGLNIISVKQEDPVPVDSIQIVREAVQHLPALNWAVHDSAVNNRNDTLTAWTVSTSTPSADGRLVNAACLSGGGESPRRRKRRGAEKTTLKELLEYLRESDEKLLALQAEFMAAEREERQRDREAASHDHALICGALHRLAEAYSGYLPSHKEIELD